MRLFTAFLPLIFSLATAETLNLGLWNGQSWTNATYHEPLEKPVHSRSLTLWGKDPCTGSFMCGFCFFGCTIDLHKLCNGAVNWIDDGKVYSTGGEARRTGVCNAQGDGSTDGCGIFIKRKISPTWTSRCSILGRDMKAKVAEIRSRGCKKCGRLATDESDECEVVIDYVKGCYTN